MTQEITLSNGKKLKNIFSVLETLAVNGYTNCMIIKPGYGSGRDKEGNRIEFNY